MILSYNFYIGKKTHIHAFACGMPSQADIFLEFENISMLLLKNLNCGKIYNNILLKVLY